MGRQNQEVHKKMEETSRGRGIWRGIIEEARE
jgi:hypothetical protein